MKTLTDSDFIAFVGKQESQYISMASEFYEETLERLKGRTQRHDNLPWSKTVGHIGFRPGEVTLWAGVNGSGKSQILGQVCAWMLDRKWLIASMEMLPAATMARMIRQIAGCEDVAERYVSEVFAFTDNRLWIYDQTDSVKPERILGMIHYAAKELGIDHIAIDSLIKCGVGREDYEAQASFVDRLCWAAKSHKVHIHLVCHIRKLDNEHKLPSKFDIRGAGEITDLVDNVLIVHRNKLKEEKQRKESLEDLTSEPDCILKCDKQRHGDWEGSFLLWHHKPSLQYTPDKTNRHMPYLLMED